MTFICVEITASSTTEFDIRVISFMNVLASHETAGFVVSVSLFVVFIEFPSSKDGILLFHSSFRCLITQMTSLEPEKISTKQYNQIPLTLDSQNKDFFCPIIQWKTKQLEREIVLRLCVRYRASLIFLPCEQLVTLFFGCLEISPYIKLLKQCGSYYGANLLTYLCQSSDQFYFVFPKKKVIAK